MKKTIVITLISLLVLSVSFASAQDDMGWVCPEGFEGQTLSVFNWSTYVADDTIPNFEAACGVSVEYTVYESNESMLAVIRQGNPGYDIVVPSDYMVDIMIDEELLEPIDLEMIPNIENVDEQFLDPAYDPGNAYSLPYQWGTVGIGYNVEAVGGEITSWEQVFAHDGNVAWLEDVRAMLGVGLIMLGEDPNTSDPDLIAAAGEYLIENGGNVVAIAADDGQALLERGDVDIAVEYNGDVYQVIFECECEDYAYIVPDEGAFIWTDNMAVPVDAPNPELALVFMDYILDVDVSADLANFTAYGSPNAVAIEEGLIDEELLTDPGIYPTDETRERLVPIEERPDAEQDYNDAWDAVKVLIGG